jgi:2-dehydropantoate 2-reductase
LSKKFQQEESMRILVFGAGGVGEYFGGRLAQAGEEVIFLARGEHLKAIQEDGLIVESIKGDFEIRPAQAVADPRQAGLVDAVLVGVKAWQVPEAAEALKPVLGPNTFVVPLSNGVEAPDQLAAVLGEEHVLGGLCRISAYIAEPGRICHAAIEPQIAFGELKNGPSSRAEALRQAFEKAQVKVEVPPDIRKALWEKFVFISALSGVGSVTRAPAGVLRSLPETRSLIERALQETIAVGRALGVDLSIDYIKETLAFVDGMPAHTTASMQRDIQEGRPSELESQNGAIVRFGRDAGVPTPVHEFIYSSLLPLEKKARKELDF